MSIDLKSLMEEMDEIDAIGGSFAIPKSSESGPGSGRDSKEELNERLTSGLLAPTQSSVLRQRETVAPVPRNKSRGKKKGSSTPKHKTWGECPVDLMADFLSLVQTGKLEEAMKTGKKIMKHEPDNPLIKMYLEALPELIAMQKAEEKKEKDSDDEEEAAGRENFVTFSNINGEAASEDEVSAGDSDSDNDNYDTSGRSGMAERKDDNYSDSRSQAKGLSQAKKSYDTKK